jgi:hypothetical protein
MGDRRPLTAGLKQQAVEVDPILEKKFVYGDKDEGGKPATASPAEDQNRKRQNGNVISRVPLTTRIREDFATALKRASLERQLAGEFPNTMLDILEEALEPWLRTHGYIK